MRNLMAAMIAGSMLLFNGPAAAADNPMTIAVFTKNRTNPAYEAARLGADRTAARLGWRTMHSVPEKPDDGEEQIGLIGLFQPIEQGLLL